MDTEKYTYLKGRYTIELVPIEQVPLSREGFRNFAAAIGESIDNAEAEFRFKIDELTRILKETKKRWAELKEEVID